MQIWKAKGVPVDDDAAMLRWYLSLGPHSQAKLSDGFRKRLSQIKPTATPNPVRPGEDQPTLPQTDNPYWAEFIQAFPEPASPDQVKQIQNLERHLHFADFALQKAREKNDQHLIKIFTDDLLKFSKAIKEQKALADKLGVESGELLPKPQAEKLVAAWCYWSMACVDAALHSLSRKLVGMKTQAEVRAVLEPALLKHKYLEPFVEANRAASGMGMPEWFTQKLVDSVDDYIESGKELMEEKNENEESD